MTKPSKRKKTRTGYVHGIETAREMIAGRFRLRLRRIIGTRPRGRIFISWDWEGNGGARRNRTDDLFNAIEALSQLSYGPTFFAAMLGHRRWTRGRAAKLRAL